MNFLFSRKTTTANNDPVDGSTPVDDIERDVASASAVPKNKRPTLRDVPKLTRMLSQSESPEDTVVAAKKLYELCDVGHKQNREPLVASGKYDVLSSLCSCLDPQTSSKNSDSDGGKGSDRRDGAKSTTLSKIDQDRLHFVLLTLNNLSIPHDNKRVMVVERGSRKLIGNLCKVVASGGKDAYLAIIVLMNLSFFEPAEVIIGQFSPRPSLRRPKLTPLENPDSLLRYVVLYSTNDCIWLKR